MATRGPVIKTLFSQGPSSGSRLMVAMVLSAVILAADLKTEYLSPVRSLFNYAATPFHWLVDVPGSTGLWLDDFFTSRATLQKDNESLKARNVMLERQLQKLAFLKAENIRLRELLNSSALVESSVLVAEIIGVDADPFRHEVIINHGTRDGVIKGQPVLGAQGLMGQVIDTGPYQSRALLITDPRHSIPVQVNRNGVRAIAVGSGSLDTMYLKHVPDTADIKKDDLLVSSGLGQRFPVGYPVARVARVEHDPGEAFARITVRPTASMEKSRHVLLVFDEQIQEYLIEAEAEAEAESGSPEEEESGRSGRRGGGQ